MRRPHVSPFSSCALLLFLPLGLSLDTDTRPGAPTWTDSPTDPITLLRADGRYAEALALARRHQSEVLAGSNPAAWQLADASRLVATLELAVALPDSARRELAHADSLEITIEKLQIDTNYKRADELAARQLEIRRRTLGGDHPEVAKSLTTLGGLATSQGDDHLALRCYTEALALRRKSLGEKHPDIAQSLGRLAMAKKGMGSWDEALALAQKALALQRELHGELNLETAQAMNALGNIYRARSDLEAARAAFLESLAIRRRIIRGDHPDIAQSLSLLALVCISQSDWTAASSYAREAVAIRRRLPSVPRENLAFSLSLLAGVLMHERRYAEAERAWQETLEIYERAQRQSKAGGFRRDGTTAWDLAASQVWQGKTEEAWISVERGLSRSLLDALLPPGPTSGTEPGERRVYSRERVQSALPPGSALLGWLETGRGRGRGNVEGDYPYWGYVIRKDGPVHWARVDAPAGRADSSSGGRLRTFALALRSDAAWPFRVTDASDLTQEARGIYDERIAPLASYLDGVEQLIVVSPDLLRGVTAEVLIDKSGSTLGDRYTVSYTPSATLFAWMHEQVREHPDPRTWRGLLVGDPVFDRHDSQSEGSAGPLLASNDALAAPSTSGFQIDPVLQRSVLDGDRGAMARLPRLPRTRDEIERVATLLPTSKVLLGPRAAEEEIRKLARSGDLAGFDLIHIATHALVDPSKGLRSALVLSQPGPGPGVADGLLTRQEIATWSLDADLVTLSACQSALGLRSWTDGYMGLTDVLLEAGARSILVSLWKVDDTATALLMGRFYENLTGAYQEPRAGRVAEPLTKAEALREAKHWLRTYTDAQGRHPFAHPVYWSAFVLIGDPD
jgi:CHAT domain-containing protein